MARGTARGIALPRLFGSFLAFAGIALAPALALGATLPSPPKPPWEAWLDPRELPRLPPGDQVLLRSSHCPSGCRFDRTSDGDPRFLRIENGEAVIFEEAGAGAVVRIWMTQGPGVSAPLDPAIRLLVRVDGEVNPRIDLPLPALFDGTTPGFTAPLAFDREPSSGGNVLYLPIPYRKGCKISLTGAEHERLWFQVTFHRLAQAGAISTYTGAEDLSAWRAILARAGNDPWPDSQNAPGARTDSGSANLIPGGVVSIPAPAAPGYLRAVRLRTSPRGAERLRLRLTFDGERRADLPLADFFAVRGAVVPPRGLLFGLADDGFLYAYFPAPFFANAKVEVFDAGAPGSRPVKVEWQIGWNAEVPAADSGRFAVAFSVAGESMPEGDLRLLDASGSGKWVGLFAEIGSVRTLSREVLEGDERVYLDGSLHPGLYGTGVEDLFNGGFYFDRGPFALPLHGSPAHRMTPAGEDVTSAYRLFLSDAIPFRNEIRAGLETGPTGNLAVRARTVAYYYSRPLPALAKFDRLDPSDALSALAHSYGVTAPDAACAAFLSRWEGGPLVAPEETATSCTYAAPGGRDRFILRRLAPNGALRLRRRLDVGRPNPAADVFVNGVRVGAFPFQEANPFRRLREVDLDIPPGVAAGATELHFEVVPRFSAAGGEQHSEVIYELWAGERRSPQ
ncbi:MAG: DUF2961 domain-containing protein [Acidobacteriota bacterium]